MSRQAFPCWALVALTFALAMPARAGIERWTPYGPPEGFLVTLAVDGGRLLAATEESGVYASTDQGLTWFRSSAGLGNERIEALAVDPDDHEIYAAGQRRFFRSTDQGAHWTVLGPLPAPEEPVGGEESVNELLTLVPGEPDVFFLSIGKALYRSTDGGGTWTSVLTWATAILSVLVDPNDSSSIFVGTVVPESRLLHSPDGGATWAPVTSLPVNHSFPFPFGVSAIAAAATTPTTLFAISGTVLYRSKDAGVTWQELRRPPLLKGSTLSVVATPGQHPRIYAFQYNDASLRYLTRSLLVSDDLGDSWVLLTKRARGTSLRVDPATGALLSSDPGGVGIAEEEGAPWRFAPFGASSGWISNHDHRPIPQVRFARGRAYAVVGGRLWESRDGQSWRVLVRDPVDQDIWFHDVAIDPRPGVLWAATAGGVYRSYDNGTTWNLSLSGVGSHRHQAVTQLDSHTLLYSGYGIRRSGDRGVTWKMTLSGVSPDYHNSDRFVDRVWAEPGNPKIVYAQSAEILFTHPPEGRAYIYQSLDGGLTWRRLTGKVFFLAIDPTQPQTLYGLGGGGLQRSDDRGRSWRRISTDLRGARDLVVDPNDPRILYAAGVHAAGSDAAENDVWRSLDGGVTWAPLRIGLDSLPTYRIFPDPRRPGRLFVASEGFFAGRFSPPGD